MEELREKRRLKKEAEAAAEAEKKRLAEERGEELEDEWKLPVKEVF